MPNKTYSFAQLGDPLKLEANIPVPMPKALRNGLYPLSNRVKEDVRKQIKELTSRDVIRPSRSPYASPTFVVYRNDKARMVHDYREMNLYLTVLAYPLPNMQNIVRSLQASKYLSSIDIMDAIYNIVLDENSRKFTAFCTEDGL